MVDLLSGQKQLWVDSRIQLITQTFGVFPQALSDLEYSSFEGVLVDDPQLTQSIQTIEICFIGKVVIQLSQITKGELAPDTQGLSQGLLKLRQALQQGLCKVWLIVY